ncbi:MAG: peptidoglycan bridge formation glycyltransferase FemA/FemB family protein [Spirochaetaceae bacterium]|nr:peptidoglycan bridge formation glycyltransferase FemA/FemB family protein [Spirochaetaceae bacterium]
MALRGRPFREVILGQTLPGVYLRNLVSTGLSRCNGASSFLQSGFWGSFKARFGWNARAFLAEWASSGGETIPLLVTRRRIGPGFSLAYVPWGPELPPGFPPAGRGQALRELAEALRGFLPRDTALIRFDPPWFTEGDTPPPLGKPFSRAPADVQPPDTVIVDLRPPGEAILRGMKPKWRYNIRLAEKKGVTVYQADEEGLDRFYALLRETAKRDGIAIHGKDYYGTLFSHRRDYAGASPGVPDIRLYLARQGEETLAAIITLFRGTAAVYLYGASSDRRRNLMAPYALQWRAMADAKAAGCLEYDLYGIPPREDPAHPMAGLYRFKTGFGGRIIHRSGSWDYAYRPVLKHLFTAAEGARRELRNIRRAFRGWGKKPGAPSTS